MSINQIGGKYFSAIAASSNPAFEEGLRKSAQPLNLNVTHTLGGTMKALKITFVVVLWACLYSQAIAKPEPKILIAREVVKANLKDPNSANFKNERVSGVVVCGEVNSKNSYGGYNGFGRYMVQDGAVYFEGKEWPLFSNA